MGYGTGLFRVKAREGVNALSAVGFKNQSAFHHHHVLAVLYNASYKYFCPSGAGFSYCPLPWITEILSQVFHPRGSVKRQIMAALPLPTSHRFSDPQGPG